MTDHKNNAVGWFEIPVADMDRAIAFYETVFDTKLVKLDLGTLAMALFPRVEGGTGTPGSLVRSEQHYKPSADGVLLYFTAHSGDLNNELSRVEAAGGKVLMPRRQISEEFGFMALALDTEGNRIAIHSRK
jgi:predicted enzyme related to lactoylglutathione lyase